MPALRRREAAPPLPHGSTLPAREVQPLPRTTAGELTAEGRAAQDDLREFVLHGWRHDWNTRMRARGA
jgi:integrase